MTILEREHRERPPTQPEQALSEGALTSAESALVGYLLGRRQDAEHIARGLGQDVHEIDGLCQRLYLRGLLSLSELQGQTYYAVR